MGWAGCGAGIGWLGCGPGVDCVGCRTGKGCAVRGVGFGGAGLRRRNRCQLLLRLLSRQCCLLRLALLTEPINALPKPVRLPADIIEVTGLLGERLGAPVDTCDRCARS